MESVVLEGTGSVYNMEGYGLIAKTGTAQISSTDGTGYLTGESDVIRGFAGMFPKEDPEIIIYANLKRPTPNTPNALVSVIKEVVENKIMIIYMEIHKFFQIEVIKTFHMMIIMKALED